MRADRIACRVALAAVLIACKKDPPTDVEGGGRAGHDEAKTAAPVAEEPEPAVGKETETPQDRPHRPGAPAKRAEDAPGSGPVAQPPSALGPASQAVAPPEKMMPVPTSSPGLDAVRTSTTGLQSETPPGAATATQAAPAPLPETSAVVQTPPPRPPIPDLRLLLTAADVTEAAGGKTEFQRTVLPGVEAGQDRQSLYFEPLKGGNFGFAIQVFRESDGRAARQRWESAFATYPNAVEVAPVAGSSFFAYWGEVLHVGFLQPHGNLVVVVSCGRKYCDSDALYALAKKANSRIR